jgi:transcriptional regulator with XRE-family HTH domain|nr:MAG TPA: Repressor protein CI [Caudoviricetes sp.]
MYEIFAKLLEERGVTAYKVSKATGIAGSTFSDWKSGRSTPKQDKLQKIADYFGVSVDFLITGKEETAVAQETHVDLKAEFNRIKKLLESGENAPLYFDGQPADQESINLLLDQIKISVALMERMRKK